MRNNSGSNRTLLDEPEIIFTIIIFLLGGLIYLAISRNAELLSLFMLSVCSYMLYPIDKIYQFFGSYLPLYQELANNQIPHELNHAMNVTGKTLRWYSMLIISVGIWMTVRAFTRNVSNLSRGALTRDEIWAINAYNFCSSLPVYGRKIESLPRYSGEWRIAQSVPLYCAENGALEISSKKGADKETYPFSITKSGHLSREPIKDITLISLNQSILSDTLSKDLGQRYRDFETMINRSPVAATLSYLFLSRIVFGKEHGYKVQDEINQIFVTIKKPTYLKPVPIITPKPLTIETLENYTKNKNVIAQTLKILDFNQCNIEHLRAVRTALKEHDSALKTNTTQSFQYPAKSDYLITLENEFASIKSTSTMTFSPVKIKQQDKQWVRIEIERIDQLLNQQVDIDKILREHAYERTILYRLYYQCTLNGVLTTSDFIWLRPLDSTLFYSLNNKGRSSAALIEGAAVHVHALCEIRLRKRMPEPRFNSLIHGINDEINDFLNPKDGMHEI